MSKSNEIFVTEIIDDDSNKFFAPVSSDLIDSLIGQYQNTKSAIAEVSKFVNGTTAGSVIHYFIEGNTSEERGAISLKRGAEQLFDEKGAVSALNAAYWAKAMNLTDVYDAMPQKRRTEWNESIRNHKTPDFEEDTVRATMTELLNMRTQFLAERVDGIFRGLSGEHVTNAPEAFGKRMIIARVLGAYGFSENDTCGLINDLRCVVAKFMSRDEPKYQASSHLIYSLNGRWGEWVSIDGGAMKIRLYKKGTAHMEVHPDMAWRLNQILAHMHPLAIPAEFRQKPKKRAKEFAMIARPLPFAVLEILDCAKQASRKVSTGWPERYEKVPNTISMFDHGSNKAAFQEAAAVLESIGGAKISAYTWEFDYAPYGVIRDIIDSGCIPDQKSHQFYPTPESLARRAVEWACIQDGDRKLEPSAGQGGIAMHMPEGTACVEISPLNCKVLGLLGLKVQQADFIEWSKTAPKFDAIVMNPPFSEGRAKAHTEAAARLLEIGGRLVSILPASHRNKLELDGCKLEWSEVIENAFAGTSVSVVMLKATKLNRG